MSLMSPALAGKFLTTHAAWEACLCILVVVICLFNNILYDLYSHLYVIPINTTITKVINKAFPHPLVFFFFFFLRFVGCVQNFRILGALTR